MKKTRSLIIVIATVFLFAGCSSSKQEVSVPADSYDSDIEIDNSKIESNKKQNSSSSSSSKQKSDGFNLLNIFSSSSNFYEYNQTSVFATGTFGGIKQQVATIFYHPKTGNAGFGSPIMAAYYNLTFDADARKRIEKAVSLYLSDFENKKLDSKAKKTYKSYGTTQTTMYWGTIKASCPNNATATVNLGYEFEKKSPYFKLTIFPVKNTRYTGSDSTYPEKSINVSFYFTKAQAQALVEALSDENVEAAIRTYENEKYGFSEDTDFYSNDYYEEYDEVEDVDEDEVEDVEE